MFLVFLRGLKTEVLACTADVLGAALLGPQHPALGRQGC